ncbi:unnamed protein product [Cyclocybe aegerita]|uniref:C2H2-type domain-containing protein n=1 Tax=Cyclocybe aegerita TaxID=1973307 RepID=A0A8S0VRV4_CYCAE|nr:unnamed protein product [Cyclocybe aegerita]
MSFLKREFGGFSDMVGDMDDDMDDDMDGDLDDVMDSPFMQMFLLMEPVSREIVAAHEREGGSHCPACGEYQDSWFDLDDHIRDEFDHHVCMDCRIAFPRRRVLLEHYINDPKHFFCEMCEDLFLNQKFLDWHRQQFHAYCYSALVNHLESGKCTSGVHRRFIENYVRQLDTRRLITDPQLSYVGPSTHNQDGRYIATNAAWNGSMFECDLCHLKFISLHNLNRHLASPRHAEKAYVCRGPTCGKRFKTFSGLVDHIGSNKCDVARFNDVKFAVDSYLGQIEIMGV